MRVFGFIKELFRLSVPAATCRATEKHYTEVQQKLIQERFSSPARITASVHVCDASSTAVLISEQPLRCYRDGMLSRSEADLLINGFERAITYRNIDDTTSSESGEATIDPLDVVSEEIIGSKAFAIANLCCQRNKKQLQEQFGLQYSDLEIAGALLTRLQYPSKILGSEDCIKNMLTTYATPHVDKSNRIKYDFSTVLYLNDSLEWQVHMRNGFSVLHIDDTDNIETFNSCVGFEGGRFVFNDNFGTDVAVVPRRGRLLMFTSGPENLHQVQHVTGGGYRYTLGIWFTNMKSGASDN